MNAALEDYRIIWRAAAAQREPGVVRALYVTAGAVGACGVIVAVLGDLNAVQALRFIIAVAFMALAFIWTFLFVPGSIRMNSPINAWLLPRQRRRLLQMTAAYLLVATLGIAYGLGDWNVLPIVALGTLGMALLMAGNKYVPYLLMAAGNAPWLVQTVLPPAWAGWMTGSAAIRALDILILPATAWGLCWLYPAGGDAYLARRADQLKRVSHFAFRTGNKDPLPDGMVREGNLSFYRIALGCDRRRADPAAMLMHALGPTAHWTAWIGAIAVMLLIAGGAGIVLGWSRGAAVQTFVGQMIIVGPGLLALLVLFSTAQYGQQLRRTRGEQALLRLTPLAGDTVQLNRRLATRLLRQALSIWVLLTVAVLAVVLPFASGPDALLRQLGLCCLAGQAAMMGLLGDYASECGGWSTALALRAGAYVLVQALVAMGLGRLTGTTAWPWLVALPLAVCVVQLRHDWRRMLAAPPAFPAGRMA
ncbi:hypothetical protein [Massilia luteola]|uniref:hypothetical protein n=1 Tax=Massilia luteola TaxID=3081751 RepID=UPI002ACBEABD|nr:hypothetical protein [Massilia sp. Gc5]